MKNRLPPERQPDDEGPLDLNNCLRPADEPAQPLPPIVEPQAPRASCFCWICREQILSRADGLNLADEGNFDLLHIHHKCHEKLWKQLPDVEKIKLRLLFQQSVTGGDLTRVIGEVRQAIVAFHSLLGLAMREYEHRSPEEYGAGEN